MHVVRIRKKTNAKRMNWRIAPPFVEETTSPVQVLEVGLILLTAEEVHVANLKVGPEVACRVSIGPLGVLRANLIIRDPLQHVIFVQVRGIRGHELLGLGPEGLDGLRSVVEVDSEAVGLVVVLHIPEHVVIDVAEELDLGLNTPVVTIVLQRRVFVEHAAVPTAHLVVRHLRGVLDILLL